MNIQDNKDIPNISGIYKITNLVNNKCYIGSAVNLRARIKRHNYELETNTHANKYLTRSYLKNGSDVFDVEILELFEEIDYIELLNIEKKYILLYDSLKTGYNLILDNSSHFKKINKSKKHIEKNRQDQSIAIYSFDRFSGELDYKFNSITESSIFFGTSTSNISGVCKGKLNYIKDHTFCYKKDYDKNKDYSNPYHWTKGKVRSNSHIEKIEKANQKRLGKDIYKYDLNWNFIEKYPSRSSAEKMNNLIKESLRRKADIRTPFEGYYWMYNKI